MTDIIERLRIESRREPHEPIWRDAIDEIEALRAEVERLHAEVAAFAPILKAAHNVMEWIEWRHRPPVRDQLEAGRMVSVRLHALADLHTALQERAVDEHETAIDTALLRQALEALELRCGTNAEERNELIPALRHRLEGKA